MVLADLLLARDLLSSSSSLPFLRDSMIFDWASGLSVFYSASFKYFFDPLPFFLFRIPHMPPAGSLKVLHAPVRWGGIWCAFQTKIYNLETDEFVSNPPFQKINLAGVISQHSFWRKQLEYFKINFKLLNFFKLFSTREHLAKGFLFEINLPKLNPYVGIISFFR